MPPKILGRAANQLPCGRWALRAFGIKNRVGSKEDVPFRLSSCGTLNPKPQTLKCSFQAWNPVMEFLRRICLITPSAATAAPHCLVCPSASCASPVEIEVVGCSCCKSLSTSLPSHRYGTTHEKSSTAVMLMLMSWILGSASDVEIKMMTTMTVVMAFVCLLACLLFVGCLFVCLNLHA